MFLSSNPDITRTHVIEYSILCPELSDIEKPLLFLGNAANDPIILTFPYIYLHFHFFVLYLFLFNLVTLLFFLLFHCLDFIIYHNFIHYFFYNFLFHYGYLLHFLCFYYRSWILFWRWGACFQNGNWLLYFLTLFLYFIGHSWT